MCVFCGNAALTVCAPHCGLPHIVATMPQDWLGLGHAVFLQKS